MSRDSERGLTSLGDRLTGPTGGLAEEKLVAGRQSHLLRCLRMFPDTFASEPQSYRTPQR